jgi:hypothetical protein
VLLALAGSANAQPKPPVKPMDRDYQIQLEVPGIDRVFRIESETAWRERIRQETRQRGELAVFPEDYSLYKPGVKYGGRAWPEQSFAVVPSFVCYKPLYFQDLNTERYGWDNGVFQPLLSTGKFYCDLLILPYKMGVDWPCACDYNSGYALPGDCVPYVLYHPEWSWRGAAMQALVIGGGILIFP